MKKINLIFLTFLFCFSSFVVWSETIEDLVQRNKIYYKKFSDTPFTGKISGKKKGSSKAYTTQGFLKNGKKEGTWYKFFQGKKLMSQGDFRNGKKEGSWIEYHFDGQLFFKGNFNKDKQEGFWERYWWNGQLKRKGHYHNGKKEGNWISYNSEGQVNTEVTGIYKNDKKISD